jgi:hypothetical protein
MRQRSLLSVVVIVLVAVWLGGCGDTNRPPVTQRDSLTAQTPVLPDEMSYGNPPMPTITPFDVAPPVQSTEGPDEAKVQFRLYKDESLLIDRSSLLMEFSDGQTMRSIQNDATSDYWVSPEFDTPLIGTLALSFTLVATTGAVLSQGTFELPLKPDRIRVIDFEVSDHNPMQTCMGCVGYKEFPLTQAYRGKPGSALYLTWGENSIKSPWIS